MIGVLKFGSLREFWVAKGSENNYGTWFSLGSSGYGYGWSTLLALLFILIFHSAKRFFFFFLFSPKRHVVRLPSSSSARAISSASRGNPQFRIPEIISEADLKFLIENLDQKPIKNEKWEHVIEKRSNLLSYIAKCCKPKDAPLKYLSVTVFEKCSVEILRDFYMDNDYRKQWDKTLVEHEQLLVDASSGVEFGRTIKKFPLLTPREYVLAWKMWEGKDKAFYCFIKECEHPLVPHQRKYVRVRFFRSGWRIRKVPGRDACEIKLFHQEDAGINVEMMKLAFARGIWSYLCKMDNALRKYSEIRRHQRGPAVTAVSFIQKVPPELEATNIVADTGATRRHRVLTGETEDKKISRRPSRKVLANGLLLLGGVICLSRGHSSFAAKVAMAYILTKLGKRDSSSGHITSHQTND